MKEITVKEFAQEFQGKTVDVESVDVCGVSVSMSKASIDYDDGLVERLIFGYGDAINGGISVSYNVKDCIDSITYDESDSSYTIKFKTWMLPDILLSTTRKIRAI